MYLMKKLFFACLLVSLTVTLACNNQGSNNEDAESSSVSELMYKDLSMEQFQSIVSKPGKLVLVDFYADWCQPCRLMKPHIEAIGEEMKDRLEVVAINVDKNKALSDALNIDGIPLLHIYKDHELVWKGVGYREKAQLEAEINQL